MSKIRIEWSPAEPFIVKTSRGDWGRQVEGTAIRLRVWVLSLMATAKDCGAYIERIEKDRKVLFDGRLRLAWEMGDFSPKNIRPRRHRGALVSVCMAEKGQQCLQITSEQKDRTAPGESGTYKLKIRADSSSPWASPSEITIHVKHEPFSGRLTVLSAIKTPWYKPVW